LILIVQRLLFDEGQNERAPAGVTLIGACPAPRGKAFVDRLKIQAAQANLLEVIRALVTPGRFARGLDRRQ